MTKKITMTVKKMLSLNRATEGMIEHLEKKSKNTWLSSNERELLKVLRQNHARIVPTVKKVCKERG